MQPTDFTQDKYGKVIKTPQDYWAYLPNPLEPHVEIDLSLARIQSDADRALSELAGIGRTLPNPHLLIRPFIRKEAVLSSKIEGTRASLSDLLFFEAGNIQRENMSDVLEVANYVQALEHGLSRLQELPVCLRLIREIHEKLMKNVRGAAQTPGEFRRSQNWIGPPGCTLMEATYVPPPEYEMRIALDTFEKYLNTPSKLPPLIRLALIHYQFEAIHPFLDGNGRIGRLLVPLLLCAEGLITRPLLYLSAYFERHRDEYYQYLLDVSRKGLWTQWISFFLQAVATQATDAIHRSDELLKLWQAYRERLQAARASALLLQLVDDLFADPAISNPGASKRLNITPRSAQQNINKLIEAGILKEATGRRRNRVYIAPDIIHIIEKDD